MSIVRGGTPPSVRRGDVAADRLSLLRSTGVVAMGYAIGASLQSAWIYSMLVPEWAQVDLWRRLLANGVSVVALVVALGALGTHRVRGGVAVAARVLTACLLMGVLRVALQLLLGVHTRDESATLLAETASGTFIALLSTGLGVWGMFARRRARALTRAAERQTVSVELAIQALEAEEIRVRRQVAEGLHGTVQQRLLLVDARLRNVQDRLATVAPDLVEDLVWSRAELAQSREQDVRQMSRLLYPERLELGLVPAVRALLSRLPSTIATGLRVGDPLRALDDPSEMQLTVAERLLAVRVVEEAVSNALKNGPPSRIEVHLELVDDELLVVVTNDGAPYEPPAAPDPASGTARLDQRLGLAGGGLRIEALQPTGARVEARLPLGVLQDEE